MTAAPPLDPKSELRRALHKVVDSEISADDAIELGDADALRRAERVCGLAEPEDGSHPYLRAKQVGAHGVLRHKDLLVVPLRDATGKLWSLQFIGADGQKRFLKGGRKVGCYHGIGKRPAPGEPLCVCEGYATGASIHEATGHAAVVAFDAGNLLPVARALRAKYPEARIVIAGDNDASGVGQLRAEEAARAVNGLVAIPAETGKDWNDIHRERGAEAVARSIAAARTPEPEAAREGEKPAAPVGTSPSATAEHEGWPEPLNDAAYHGLAGEIVRAIEPLTESDPAAILLQVLVAFGALVGRGPHFRVEHDEHHTNLFILLVGETSKARKGTSWGRVCEVFRALPDFPREQSGLSSGEGLMCAVRDPVKKKEVEIPGVDDKRLLVVEREFAQVLRQTARAGNVLSATIRTAWDSGNLRILTRNDPITATGAHICIVGHITADELRAELAATDIANGFANRILLMCVRRSKLLPHGGGPLAEDVLDRFRERIGRAVSKARSLGAVGFTDAARTTWERVYPRLSEGYPGLLGAVTARAEAQCLRLALVYALMDGAPAIDRPHLLAAIAVWERAEASARYVFGSALGDRVADEILRALRAAGNAGMTRTSIRDLFSRNERAERIGAALDLLARRGLVQRREQTAQSGRPAEIWVAR